MTIRPGLGPVLTICQILFPRNFSSIQREQVSNLGYNADFSPQTESFKVSYLASEGFDNYLNKLKDLSSPIWKEIKSTIMEHGPNVVGISAKSQNYASACIVAKLAKEVSEQIIVIVGGPHPSMVGPEVLDCLNIDIGVKGEGERTIVELLDAIRTRKKFDGIKGIIYRKDEQIVENAPRELIRDLDSLSFPHESAPEVLIGYHEYPQKAFFNIYAIRGCPYNCLFCGNREVWGREMRFRSPDNVIREIKGIQKMGINYVYFNDDVFGVDKKYIFDLCNAMIIHCPKLRWTCSLHVNLVDEQIVSLLKAAGCNRIKIGIESGNNEILKEIRKNITIEEALSACELIKKHGIELNACFMVGFPQETEDTLSETVEAMKKTKCNALVYSIFTPYPGTEAFELCREKGLIDDNYDVSLFNHQSPANCFTFNIAPERFRFLVSMIEEMVDKINSRNRIKRIFSLNSFRRRALLPFWGKEIYRFCVHSLSQNETKTVQLQQTLP